MHRRTLLSLSLGLSLPAVSWAHGDAHAHKGPPRQEQKPWGIAGRRAQRSVRIEMGDDMRFRPDRIAVREGETLRIRVHNRGRMLHEFVLGTPAELQQHAAMMLKFPDMAHDEPYMTHVKPGAVGEIVWTFNRPGEFQFACLIAGHFQAGMVGTVVVSPKEKP